MMLAAAAITTSHPAFITTDSQNTWAAAIGSALLFTPRCKVGVAHSHPSHANDLTPVIVQNGLQAHIQMRIAFSVAR